MELTSSSLFIKLVLLLVLIIGWFLLFLVYSKGSVVVAFVVYFNTPVTTDRGLANLQKAVANGNLGEFKVSGPLKIVDRENRPTVVSTVESTAATAATSTTSSQKGDSHS